MTLSVPSAARRSSSRARLTAAASRARPPRLHVGPQLGLDRRVHPQDGADGRRPVLRVTGCRGQRRSAVSVKQLTPTTCSSPVSMRRTRSAWLPTRRALSSSMASKAPPSASTSSQLGPRGLGHLGRLLLDDHRAVEDVLVLEQVRLEGQDLLDAQRPLLVPGPGQPERLVPGRQLHGPGPGPLGQGDPEGLEDDAGHVVLRLGLGEPERVDLHAVAEPPQLGVGHAVALGADPVPQRGEGPHLAGLLDEPDAGVDEEGDAPDDRGEVALRDLARLAHGVEHPDGGGQGVGDLLGGRGPRLLQVVAADVDRVPLGDVAHGVGDGVDGQPAAGERREDEGPPRQVLLHDVVLGGPRQDRGGRRPWSSALAM